MDAHVRVVAGPTSGARLVALAALGAQRNQGALIRRDPTGAQSALAGPALAQAGRAATTGALAAGREPARIEAHEGAVDRLALVVVVAGEPRAPDAAVAVLVALFLAERRPAANGEAATAAALEVGGAAVADGE